MSQSHSVWIRGMEQRYGTDPSNRYGTELWNEGMDRVWSRTLFRKILNLTAPYFDLGVHDACSKQPELSLVAGMLLISLSPVKLAYHPD